ncbi:hypothetical protein [Actinosynnema sp. NPDC023587]|uniref:hypothetical protein n=1 Tax=Actinosynnema sp. NPDC023587 TaxID=3154695 RepID=UPI00340428DD
MTSQVKALARHLATRLFDRLPGAPESVCAFRHGSRTRGAVASTWRWRWRPP